MTTRTNAVWLAESELRFFSNKIKPYVDGTPVKFIRADAVKEIVTWMEHHRSWNGHDETVCNRCLLEALLGVSKRKAHEGSKVPREGTLREAAVSLTRLLPPFLTNNDDGWRLGAERMREACAKELKDLVTMHQRGARTVSLNDAVEALRALPLPDSGEPLAQLRDEVRELLYLAIQELSYCHSAETFEQVTSAKGEWIVDEAMKLLGVKDLSEDSLRAALASPETRK